MSVEVKPGYKLTEVGVIPEDWEIVQLFELVTAGPKNGYSGRCGKEYRGTPTLSLAATTPGCLVLNDETVKWLYEAIDSRSDLYLQPGDVLVQRSNTTDLVGTTAVFDGPAGVYVYPDLMMRMRFREEATAHWFWRYANSAGGRRHFVGIAAGSSGSMPKISGEKLRRMTLPLPPLPEQRAIATALSDVDALLGGLDRLIAKKRDLKQAAMQQLLTGQTRLPGKWIVKLGRKQTEAGVVPEDWEVKQLGAVLSKGRLGGNYPNEDAESPYPLMKMGNLARGYFDISKVEHITPGVTPEPAHRLLRGDVLFNTRNTLDLVGKVAIWRDELPVAYYNSNLMRLEFNPDEICSNEYANYALNTTGVVSRLRGLATGTTSVAAIYTRDLMRLQIIVPPKPEQSAIAAVLSDIDAELAALEARRDKTRALKQAMMQELLTGRTRLVSRGDAKNAEERE